MQLTRPTILGFVAGFVLGMGDYLLLTALDVEMIIDGEDATLSVVLLFALNFGALGAVIARLWEHRKSLEEQAELIRRQYQELSDMQETLIEHETLAAIGQMSAGVAHEVRNPLSVIRSSAQMLAEDLEGQDAEVVTFIHEEVDRLDDFVSRVLEFSKHVDVDTEPTEWSQLRARLAQTLPEEVELDDAGSTYDVDPELMVRILANLVDNARKAGDDVNVRVVARPRRIEVVDDGPGIEPEDLERIFEPFFTTRAQGTGLGLAMARKLARVQGWDLTASSDASGATFRLVPRQETEESS